MQLSSSYLERQSPSGRSGSRERYERYRTTGCDTFNNQEGSNSPRHMNNSPDRPPAHRYDDSV
jgi:hypothetical protein